MSEELSDDELRKRWREAGGYFYGPKIETGAMPEAKLLPYLRELYARYSKGRRDGHSEMVEAADAADDQMQGDIEFEGYPDGDCECYCIAVDDDTYRKVTGHRPSVHDRGSFNHPGLLRLYPGDFIKGGNGKKLRIRVEVEEIS